MHLSVCCHVLGQGQTTQSVLSCCFAVCALCSRRNGRKTAASSSRSFEFDDEASRRQPKDLLSVFEQVETGSAVGVAKKRGRAREKKEQAGSPDASPAKKKVRCEDSGTVQLDPISSAVGIVMHAGTQDC